MKKRLPFLAAIIGPVVISDLLLGFHLSFWWIIPFLTFIMIPGWLFVSLCVTRKLSSLTKWLYSYGLGLFILLALGLLINSVGHAFSKGYVLSQMNIVIGLHALIGIEIICILMLNRQIFMQPVTRLRLPKFRPMDTVVLLPTVCTIVAVIGGVNLLNNGGSNWLVMLGVCIGVVTLITTLLLRKYLSMWSLLGSLFGVSVGLLLLTSLRSSYLVGSDVLNEYSIFQVVAKQGFWSISQINNTYNACLSITVLPQTLHAITGESGLFIFRTISQVLFSAAPLLLFATARVYLKPALAYLASVSFLVFINYNGSLPNHVRQEVSLLFFMFAIMTILSKELGPKAQRLFLFLFSAAMVVSHYSTAYVALLIFIVAAVTNYAIRHSQHKRVEQSAQLPASVLNLRMVGAILLLTIFWYSQIIQSSGGPIMYIKSLGTQIVSGDSTNQHAAQTSLLDQFNIFASKNPKQADTFADYVKDNKLSNVEYSPEHRSVQSTRPTLKPSILNSLCNLAAELIKKVYKFVAIGGMVFLLYQFWRKRSIYDAPYAELVLGCLVVIGLSFVIPSFTVNYDQERMFQQLLVIIAIALIYFADALLRLIKLKWTTPVLSLFMGAYLLISTNFVGQVAGGLPLPLQLNNSGVDYARYYVHGSEVLSAQWMQQVHRYEVIYADPYAANRIAFAARSLNVRGGLNPNKFLPGSFIYYDSGNTTTNLTYASLNNDPLVYTAPTGYLNQNADTLYANGGSTIYEKPY